MSEHEQGQVLRTEIARGATYATRDARNRKVVVVTWVEASDVQYEWPNGVRGWATRDRFDAMFERCEVPREPPRVVLMAASPTRW